MQYLSEGKVFDWSYDQMRSLYWKYKEMSDEDFMTNLPHILHFAAFACFIKEIPTYVCLTDTGIVHELIHLLANGINGSTTTNAGLIGVRRLFNEQLQFV